MKAAHEKYHLIDRFLRGELTEGEQAAFLEDLKDPAFAAEVGLQQEVNEMISVNAYHQLRSKMQDDIRHIEKNRLYKKWLGLTLVLLALLSACVYLYLTKLHSPAVKRPEPPPAATSRVPDPMKEEQAVSGKKPVALPTSRPPALQKTSGGKAPGSGAFTAPQETTFPGKDTSLPIRRDPASPERIPLLPHAKVADSILRAMQAPQGCEDVHLKAGWKLVDACRDKNDGKFLLDENSIQGGAAPYAIHLSREGQEIPPTEFSTLKSAAYQLRIEDEHGCSTSWTIHIREKFCRNEPVSISVNDGEKWVYRGKEGENYYLSILNEGGQLIFKSSLLSGNYQWPETSIEYLPTGLYIYLIEYTNGMKDTGQITIIK